MPLARLFNEAVPPLLSSRLLALLSNQKAESPLKTFLSTLEDRQAMRPLVMARHCQPRSGCDDDRANARPHLFSFTLVFGLFAQWFLQVSPPTPPLSGAFRRLGL